MFNLIDIINTAVIMWAYLVAQMVKNLAAMLKLPHNCTHLTR